MREVREAERGRMARDLHDGVLQDLSYTAATIGAMMLEAKGTKLERNSRRPSTPSGGPPRASGRPSTTCA
jgi:signal transduction histidine kinase